MMFLFFSDLDGTLLDHDTYSYAAAGEALDRMREMRCPLVLVSSKTHPEIMGLHDEMRLSAPFIFENGGGIYWPEGGGRIEYLGMRAADLKEKKDMLDAAFGEAVLFITDMDAGEVALRTGLPLERAVLSQKRSTSLPFILPSGRTIGTRDLLRLNEQMRVSGFSVTRGGRFYHFASSRSDKGVAIGKVSDYYRRSCSEGITSIGIGDSENDIPMFGAVDIPVLVRKRDGTAIATGDRRVRITNGIGPAGFNEAVTGILRTIT